MIEIAKNLLEGKTCLSCEHSRGDYFTAPALCRRISESGNSFPEENTCIFWKKIEIPELKMSTTKVTAPARKLKVKWTKESVENIKDFYNIERGNI